MQSGWKRLLVPVSGRDLATLWLVLAAITGLAGLTLGLLIRAELAQPGIQLFSNPARYNDVVMMHGMVLNYFFALPLLVGGFGNLVVADLLEREDAKVRLVSRVAVYLFAAASVAFVLAPVLDLLSSAREPAASGWTLYPPLAGGNDAGMAFPVIAGALLVCIAALVLSVAGLVWTAVSAGASSFVNMFRQGGGIWMVAGMGVAAVQLLADARTAASMLAGTSELLPDFGTGLSAGEVTALELVQPDALSVALLLLSVGLIVAIAARSAGRPTFLWIVSIVSLSLLLAGLALPRLHLEQMWLDHPWIAEMVLDSRFAVPLALVGFASLIALLLARPVPFLEIGWSIGFALIVGTGVYAMGGIGGAGVDMALHDTYYVVAHLHFLAGMAVPFAAMAGLVAHYPSMTASLGAMIVGWVGLLLTTVGTLVTFFPMYWLGLMGMPRRYVDYPEMFAQVNAISSTGAAILGVAGLLLAAWLAMAIVLRKTLR